VNRQPRSALSSLLLVAGLLTAMPAIATAEGHGTDLFGGYSFAKIDEVSRHGGDLALGFDLAGPISGFVDASFHWGSSEGASLSDVTLMAGPGVRFGKRGSTVFFARALVGVVSDKASIQVLDVDISESSSRFGILAGGGVDFRVSASLAARVQGDYLWSDVEEGSSSGFRASAGIVYRFGSAR
jgi:opacity protein-like surface antigen